MTAITVEQFLTSPSDPEDELDDVVEQPTSTSDPLVSIAHTLDRMLAIAEHHELEESEADRLREAHDDLDAKHAVLFDLVEEIEAIVKPSTSKLANTVREAIGRWRGVEPASGPVDEPAVSVVDPGPAAVPAKDASVEEWRAYAVRMGATEDVSQLNRSQIRTMLGVDHT